MRLLTTLTLLAGLSVGAASLKAQDSTQATRNVPDSLVGKAKISEDSARAIALKRVPGTVENTTLTSRRGRLAWVFEVKRAGRLARPMHDVGRARRDAGRPRPRCGRRARSP